MSDELNMEFYAAYIPNGDKKNYLSNEQGGIRLLRDRQLLENYLREKLSPEEFEKVVIHPVSGTFALPPELEEIIIPYSPKEPMVITTLYPATVPSAEELLQDVIHTRKRHKPKGAR